MGVLGKTPAYANHVSGFIRGYIISRCPVCVPYPIYDAFHFMQRRPAGVDPWFSWGGGGGVAQKSVNERETWSPFRQGSMQGPLTKGSGSPIGLFNALSCYLSLSFKHSDTKWDIKKKMGGGGLLRPLSIRHWPGLELISFDKELALRIPAFVRAGQIWSPVQGHSLYAWSVNLRNINWYW